MHTLGPTGAHPRKRSRDLATGTVRIESFTEDDIEERFPRGKLELTRLTPGSIPVLVTVVALGQASIISAKVSAPIIACGTTPPGYLTLLMSRAGAAARVDSQLLDRQTCAIFVGEAPFDVFVPAGCDLIALSVAAHDCHQWLPTPVSRAIATRKAALLITADSDGLAWLIYTARCLAGAATRDPHAFRCAEFGQWAREMVFEAAGRAFTSTLDCHVADRALPSRHWAVMRARDYVYAHPHRHISLADLCDAAGTRARTLEYGFRDLYGVSPTAFVRSARLCGARRDLRRAARSPHPVATAAKRWGFSHMGQFARDYRRLFGESPSATIPDRVW